MSDKEKFLQLMKNSPGFSIELGTIWAVNYDTEKWINLCLRLKITKTRLGTLINELCEEAEQIWWNEDEIEEAIKEGSIPDFRKLMFHEIGGYFVFGGGGMSSEDIQFLTEGEAQALIKS